MSTLWSFLLTLLVAVSMSTAQETVTLSARQPFSQGDAATSLRVGEKLTGFGYADRYVDKINYIGVQKPNIYLACFITLPDVGANKITHISFPAAKNDSEGYLLILSEDGKTTLYNQKYSIVMGENQAKLTTPFSTEAGKRYLVGFSSKTANDSYFLLPFDGKEEISEAKLFAAGTKPYPTPEGSKSDFEIASTEGYGFGAISIFATLEDMSKLQNAAYLRSVSGSFELVKKDEECPVVVALRNVGAEEIKSFELSYQFGTAETKTLSYTLTKALAVGRSEAFTLQVPAGAEGMGSAHFAITKVNDKANFFAGQRKDLPYQIGDNDAISRETVLVERFTSEKCGNCPPQDANVKKLLDQLASSGLRVAYVMHHAGYYEDFLTLPESEKLVPHVYKGNGSYAPALTINRTLVTEEDALVAHPAKYDAAAWTKKMKDQKQGAKIEKIAQTITGDKLSIVVSGVALKGAFNPDEFYLTVILTEDNIASKSQGGAPKNYKHEAVPRLFLTGALGNKITPAADGSFSVTLEGKLDAGWVKEQCKVVAFAHNNIENKDKSKRSVHTVEWAHLGSGLANEDVAAAEAPIVMAEDGYLTILGDVDAFELYDMSGALVTTSIETPLQPGTYVIRVFSNLRVYTSKVIVR